jgi:hypothetical protein
MADRFEDLKTFLRSLTDEREQTNDAQHIHTSTQRINHHHHHHHQKNMFEHHIMLVGQLIFNSAT